MASKKAGKQRAKALKARAEKRARKWAAMKREGGTSDYARKKAEQLNGTFRPTSPFEYGTADQALMRDEVERNRRLAHLVEMDRRWQR